MTGFKDKIEQPDKPSEIPVAQTDIPPAFDPTKMSENSATESKQFFDDIFKTYTTSCQLVAVKTANLGSLSKLTYDIVMKDPDREKEMIDALRCRNGNLEISICAQPTDVRDL